MDVQSLLLRIDSCHVWWLSEQCSLRLWYLKTWSPVSGVVWGRYRRCGFATGRLLLGVGFESKSLQLPGVPSLSPLHACV